MLFGSEPSSFLPSTPLLVGSVGQDNQILMDQTLPLDRENQETNECKNKGKRREKSKISSLCQRVSQQNCELISLDWFIL